MTRPIIVITTILMEYYIFSRVQCNKKTKKQLDGRAIFRQFVHFLLVHVDCACVLYAVLYAVLNDRWVTCRREFKMDVLFVGLSFLNLGCFLVILLYLGKNYIPEWLHDMFQWGKTKRETKQSGWIQYLHVPNRWVETSG